MFQRCVGRISGILQKIVGLCWFWARSFFVYCRLKLLMSLAAMSVVDSEDFLSMDNCTWRKHSTDPLQCPTLLSKAQLYLAIFRIISNLGSLKECNLCMEIRWCHRLCDMEETPSDQRIKYKQWWVLLFEGLKSVTKLHIYIYIYIHIIHVHRTIYTYIHAAWYLPTGCFCIF